MHELSLASSVLEIVLRHAAGRKVTRVELEVGALRQVVPASLSFSFEMMAQGTPAEGASVKIETTKAWGKCRACGVVSELSAFPLRCGACGSFTVNIVAGQELLVASLELEDDSDGDDCD